MIPVRPLYPSREISRALLLTCSLFSVFILLPFPFPRWPILTTVSRFWALWAGMHILSYWYGNLLECLISF
ncbi:hypothetical protein F5Y07DRAFT_176095 [Xylaria sp. FL0933]|nr:hypothetical protein F5Y07DRAFT_176095 [Xylaria sp. FL0933]